MKNGKPIKVPLWLIVSLLCPIPKGEKRQEDRVADRPARGEPMAGLCQLEVLPWLIMTVVEMETVICEQAWPSTDKTQALPNLKGLQVHCGKSLLEAMTSPVEGRAKNQTTLFSAVYFKITIMFSLLSWTSNM